MVVVVRGWGVDVHNVFLFLVFLFLFVLFFELFDPLDKAYLEDEWNINTKGS